MLPTDAGNTDKHGYLDKNWTLKKAIGDLVHNKVEDLSFHSGKISDEGAKALAEALKVNTTLQKLDLYYNRISAQGAEALAEAQKVNTALRRLRLEAKSISDAVREQIETEKRVSAESSDASNSNSSDSD